MAINMFNKNKSIFYIRVRMKKRSQARDFNFSKFLQHRITV